MILSKGLQDACGYYIKLKVANMWSAVGLKIRYHGVWTLGPVGRHTLSKNWSNSRAKRSNLRRSWTLVSPSRDYPLPPFQWILVPTFVYSRFPLRGFRFLSQLILDSPPIDSGSPLSCGFWIPLSTFQLPPLWIPDSRFQTWEGFLVQSLGFLQ